MINVTFKPGSVLRSSACDGSLLSYLATTHFHVACVSLEGSVVNLVIFEVTFVYFQLIKRIHIEGRELELLELVASFDEHIEEFVQRDESEPCDKHSADAIFLQSSFLTTAIEQLEVSVRGDRCPMAERPQRAHLLRMHLCRYQCRTWRRQCLRRVIVRADAPLSISGRKIERAQRTVRERKQELAGAFILIGAPVA